jgi:hypothetical protein
MYEKLKDTKKKKLAQDELKEKKMTKKKKE